MSRSEQVESVRREQGKRSGRESDSRRSNTEDESQAPDRRSISQVSTEHVRKAKVAVSPAKRRIGRHGEIQKKLKGKCARAKGGKRVRKWQGMAKARSKQASERGTRRIGDKCHHQSRMTGETVRETAKRKSDRQPEHAKCQSVEPASECQKATKIIVGERRPIKARSAIATLVRYASQHWISGASQMRNSIGA